MSEREKSDASILTVITSRASGICVMEVRLAFSEDDTSPLIIRLLLPPFA